MRWVHAMNRVAVLALLLCSAPSQAHHGGAVEWRDDVAGPLTGVATEFFFRFPHIFVALEVTDGATVTHWRMTSRWTPTILRNHGWTRNSIRPGDTVTVTYTPHVSDPTVGQMQTIEVNGESLPLGFD